MSILSNLFGGIFRNKKNFHYLSEHSFSDVDYQFPLVLNADIDEPLMLSRAELRAGLFLDGKPKVGLHTVGGIYLTQLISQGGGVLAFIDDAKDSLEAIQSSANFYNRLSDVIVINELNASEVTKGDLLMFIKQNKIIVICCDQELTGEAQDRVRFANLIVRLASVMIKAPNDHESNRPPLTLLASSAFFGKVGVHDLFPLLNTQARDMNWGRILVDSSEKVYSMGYNETYSTHLGFCTEGGHDYAEERAQLEVGQFVMAVDGKLVLEEPEYAKFVTIPPLAKLKMEPVMIADQSGE
ncbi:hypothetical protein [Vibrio crassostreae]|uniref:hypothetical protein n=1 Tax=Vibrio crassostreae TaxID=246167 RepID=UPI001B316808|nr:hypothetical protein [Vibrio crassostreae]